MRGAVLYGPRDVRFEDRPDTDDRRADRCHHPDVGHVRVRIRPVAVPRRQPDQPSRRRWATNTAASSRKSAARSRSIKPGQFVIGSFFASDNTCPHCQAGYQTSCEHAELVSGRAGAAAARPARGRHAGRDAGGSVGRSDPELAGALRRDGHRLVRRRRRQREAGHDGRGRRRRRGRPARCACRPSRWAPSGSSR